MEQAKARVASLEARLKGATEARRAWGLEEAQLREAVSLLSSENESLEARLAKEKEKLAKAREAKKAALLAAEEARVEALAVRETMDALPASAGRGAGVSGSHQG